MVDALDTLGNLALGRLEVEHFARETAQRLWAKVTRSASNGRVEYDLDFGSTVDAEEWLAALSGDAPKWRDS